MPAGHAVAYTGGPVRVQVLGYDPTEAKLYFSQQAYDEAGEPPQTYYFSLNSPNSPQPVHAVSLDLSVDSLSTGAGARRLAQIQKRLVPLPELRDVEFGVTVKADSTGFDSRWNQVEFALEVHLDVAGTSRIVELPGYCRPTVGVKDLYRVPGRPEILAVLISIGRAYGCEEVEVPVVLHAAAPSH